MAQLLLVVTCVGDAEPTATVSVYDAASAGREFRRGSMGHALDLSVHAMVARFACEGWADVNLFLKDEGHLHHFQPWIEGGLDRVMPSDGTELPGVTGKH